MFYNLFHNLFNRLKVGEYLCYDFDIDLDPFSNFEGALIEVIDIKNGYIKYKYHTNNYFSNNTRSMEKSEFLFYYTRVNSLDSKRKEKILNSSYFNKKGQIKCSDL